MYTNKRIVLPGKVARITCECVIIPGKCAILPGKGKILSSVGVVLPFLVHTASY